jgi:hypothetical protein
MSEAFVAIGAFFVWICGFFVGLLTEQIPRGIDRYPPFVWG